MISLFRKPDAWFWHAGGYFFAAKIYLLFIYELVEVGAF